MKEKWSKKQNLCIELCVEKFRDRNLKNKAKPKPSKTSNRVILFGATVKYFEPCGPLGCCRQIFRTVWSTSVLLSITSNRVVHFGAAVKSSNRAIHFGAATCKKAGPEWASLQFTFKKHGAQWKEVGIP